LEKAEAKMSGKIKYYIAWFNRSDWAEIKALCAPNDLHDTYDEWLANVEGRIKLQSLADNDVEKIILTPENLRNWKATNSGEINSKVRARLAVEIGYQSKNTRH
jgi:hypothetical protein